MYLPTDTLLQGGKYKILAVLGQGGFGITYLAENVMLEGRVAIKEFFFKQFCDRDETSHVTIGTSGNREIVKRFKQKFIKEARTIFKLNHPNIVRILDIFEENNTAYYVMEYIDGESLKEMVKRRGSIPEQEAIAYVKDVGSALSHIHSKNMNHLDIKPGNIMKRRDNGQILVIDFGVAKQYDTETSEGTTTTPVGISHGYSPMEQYRSGGVQTFSPQSDVYALAATLYKLLTGVIPPEAIAIQDDGLPLEPLRDRNVSASVIAAIETGMKKKRQRPQSIEDFVALLDKQTQTPSPKPTLPNDADNTLFVNPQPNTKPKPTSSVQIEEKSDRTTFKVKGVEFDMIKVEGGSFMMGTSDDSFWNRLKEVDDLKHKVTLSNYLIGETQVTQALWEAVMGNNPSYFKGANNPVECVSWNDCQTFISKLNECTGKKFRLPTEAEWEFAARGGTQSKGYQYSGSNNIDDVAWYLDNRNGATHPVKTKQPNELGIYDMSGNVWEWCQDWYGDYSSSAQTNPKGPNSGYLRVNRGGGWLSYARRCRSADRDGNGPDDRDDHLGVRLALSE